jgi:uncharacterized protein (DUF4213/DUF364 family)
MPQLVKGGKWIFGWVIVGPRREIHLPPEAYQAYGFRAGEPVVYLRGSRRSGGFSIGRLEKVEKSKVPLHLRAFGLGKIGLDSQIEIPLEAGIQPGDRLLVVRGSGMALSLLRQGPIYALALKHAEIETFGGRISKMELLNDLIATIHEDAPVRSILVGAHWTVVCSRRCGMASTILGNKPHGHEKVRYVGHLQERSALELAEFARSDNLLEASIGVAAINSLLEVNVADAVEVNAGEVLVQRGKGKNVALVGHFPFIPELRQAARQLWVIEQHPSEGEYPDEAASELVPQADVVALTGSSLINHTLDGLLDLCRPDAMVMVLGPSTPLSPVLFQHGATYISGTHVIDEELVLQAVAQGAMFRQLEEGVRLLTLSRPGD